MAAKQKTEVEYIIRVKAGEGVVEIRREPDATNLYAYLRKSEFLAGISDALKALHAGAGAAPKE